MYLKTITIDKNADSGNVQIINYKNSDNGTCNYTVDRHQIEQLVRKISDIWNLPPGRDNNDYLYTGPVLTVRVGNNTWSTGKPIGCSQIQPSVTVTQNQQTRYNNVINIIKKTI